MCEVCGGPVSVAFFAQRLQVKPGRPAPPALTCSEECCRTLKVGEEAASLVLTS